ncbi:MAG: TnpV protein [Eubacteriales bacterium]|nr:TnpV protein [Eubacteriales bacterium]
MNNDLAYTRCGVYYIPNLTLSEAETKSLGKYGRMREKFLQEYRPVLWDSMILSEKLYPPLREIDEKANRKME